MRRFAALLLLAFATAPLFAANSSQELIVPIVARLPGAFGSQWRTDLVIANVSRPPMPVTMTIQFMRNGEIERSTTTTIEPRMTMVFDDVVANFGVDAGAGLVRIVAAEPLARLTARARVFNVGSSIGEFGQNVPALPFQSLGRRSYLSGVTGAGLNRTNVGIANPQNVPTDVSITLFDQAGGSRASRLERIPARSVTQINDIFGWLGVSGFGNGTIELVSNGSVYGYASIVRSDSGDAVFVNEVSVSNAETETYIVPGCTAPAGLFFIDQPAPGWIVVFNEGVNVSSNVARLAETHKFTPQHIYESALLGFAALLTPEQVAAIRCDPTVRYIGQNGIVRVGAN